ncbi:hypothetical protein AB0D35_29405, partial [Streptomyces sp. NPDC048301]
MSVSDETTTVSDGILLSDAAAAKVKALLEQDDDVEQTREESLRLLGRLHRKAGPMRYEQVRR